MRALALLLVALNLLYFAWVNWIDAPPQAAPQFSEKTAPTLVLASERKNQLKQTPVVEPTPEPSPAAAQAPPGPVCRSVGPFQDLPGAVQASATLQSSGLDSRQRVASGELWVGYWVSVQTSKSREEAERAMATLKQYNVNDAYVIPSADPPHVVSLGVFREQERAHRLAEQVKALGLAAQIADRTRPGAVYWLDVTLADSKQPLDLTMLGAQPGKIVRLEVRDCPAAAVNPENADSVGRR